MEKYISLKEAAKIFGYSCDYLSYLIRKGKIKGKRISSKPSLQTTREAILEYKEKREGGDGTLKDKYSGIDLNQWISLEEATRISGYHPDYIGWLIRKGKIKGRKIYSDYSWLTTKESIKKYQRELEKSKPKFVRIHHLLSKTFSISWRSLYAAFIIFILISELFPAQFFQAAIANITGKETKTIEIYSKLTSGNWQNSEKAKGPPNLKPDADFDLFSESNSAVYKNGSQSLIFENFDAGDFENFDFQSARIKFSFAIGEKKSDIKIIDVQPVISNQQPAISNQEPVTNEEQTSSENILPEEPSSFWQRIKKFFVGLGEKLVMAVRKLVKGAIELVEAEELPENISTNTISDLDAKIVIWWSLDGQNWQKLKTISDYPLSNKLNGGYFELEAPFLKSFDDVKNLKIKFEGVIGGETNLVAYLDSVWVEVEYQQATSSEQSKAANNEQLNTTSSEQLREVATTSEATTTEATTTEATTTEATSTQATTTATSTIEKIKPKIKIKDNSLLFNLFKKYFLADEAPAFEIEEPKANLQELIDTGKGEIIEGEIIPPEVSTTSTATSTEATTTEATSNISLSILEEATTTESTTTQSEITTTTESTTTEATTTETEFTPVLKVKIFDPQGIESQIQPEILSQKADGKEKFEIKLPKERNFRPGKWKMEIELETEDAIFVTEQDFTWGILAINVNKSIFVEADNTPIENADKTLNGGEKVYIQMAALRDDGHTICDARLRLQILNPKSEILNLSTEDGTIQKSGECGPNNVTNVPDYFAYYPVVEADGTPAENADKTLMPGTYQMKLTNLDNGYEIEDSFEVRESVPFDVERIGPTRIYPPAAYEMRMIIKVNQDFEGKVIEMVPTSFEILEADSTLIKNADNTPISASNQPSALDQRTNQRLSASINTENATKQIIWEVTWKAGEEYELRYQFDAPDISPYLYLLGPLEFYQHQSAIFAEQRQWQIAADSPGTQIKTVEFFIYQFATTGANDDIADGNGIKDTTWPASCGDANDASVTINLPESGIIIRTAYVEWRTVVEDPDGGTTPAGAMRFCRSDLAGSPISQTVGKVAADSGESFPFLLRMDVTSHIAAGNYTYYFNAKFTGAVRNSDNAKIVITYEYNDTSATQLKTVRLAIGCRYTQAAAGTTDSFTVNPNLTDPSISVVSHWVEYSAIKSTGTADNQHYVILNGVSGPSVQLDGVNTTGFGYTIFNQFSTANINLTADNTIGLRNEGAVADAKCGEWVITYTHATGGTQVKTVRYFAGQLSGGIGTGDTEIGTPSVCIPEISYSFRKVWVRYQMSVNAAATITMRVTVGSASQITQTMALPASVWGGGETISLYDITSNFSTNFSAPCTSVRVGISSSATAASGPRAEVIVAYGYDAVNSNDNLKTVWWFVGQDYAANAANTAFTGSFNTYIPEDSNYEKTWRSAAVFDECHHTNAAGPSCSITVDSTEVAGTDSNTISFVMDNESALNNTGILANQLKPSPLASQSNISFSYNSAQEHTSGGVAYTTYQITKKVPILNQRSFIWQNDDGTNVNNNTTSTAPDTSLTMEKGERAVFRVQIDNTGTGATTTTFNLQWATTTGTCTTSLTWNDVTANSEISWSYGLSGNNGDALTTSTCAANSNTWTNGKWFEATSTTGSFTLATSTYTEFGFMIQTANAIASTTYCLRLNNNGQALNNYYKFGQLSIVSSPTKRYSKDAVSSLPSTTTDLTYYLDNKGYSNVTSDDSVYDPITSSSSIPVFLFAKKNTNNTDAINITWNGQSTVAPSSATVTMEIWNGSSWEQVASNNSAGANTDFTLSGTKLGTNYYNGSYWVYVRVYQGSGTQTLKTDYISITFGALVTISGTVYTDEGSTPIGSGRTVRIKVNGAGDYSTSTDANGNYSIPVIINATSDVVTVFLDGATEKAVTVTRASSTSANITGLNLYQNRIIVRHEDSGPITISDLDKYDSEQDPDVLFTASSTAGTLTASSTSEFFIWTGKTFGSWGSGGVGGTISLADVDIRGTFTATSSQTIFVSGNWDATTTAVFNSASSTVTFTAATGKTIRTNGKAFWNLTFNGSGGVWTFLDAATTTNDLTITAGTASSTYDMRVYGGDVTGDGILNWTGGTFYLAGTGYFGGTNPWNFNNLTFGTGSAGTTTCTSTNSITLSGDLTVSSSHTLTGSKSFTVNGGDATGDGVINLTGGTFLLDGTGNFGGASNWTFYNLTFGDGIGVATTTKTGNGNITVSNVLTISANQTLNASSQTWTLSGGGTPFVINGTFNSQTSTFKYTATVNATITAATYYNLELSPSGGGGGSGSQGPNNPASVVDDSSVGTNIWSSPMNATSSDDVVTAVSIPGTFDGTNKSHYLKATNFGFSIPSGSTINGIVVEVERAANAANAIGDYSVKIVKGGTATGTDHASGEYWPTADTYKTYGSSTDLWGETWTSNDINSTGFGAAISAQNFDIEGRMAEVDHIRITVYYTSGAAPTYTLGLGTFIINGTTTIGDGTNGVSVTADTNDPILDVNGNFAISANATFIASNSATSTFAGNWTNSGTFTHSNGTIIFDATSTGKTIKTGGSPFYNLTFNGSGGGWTFLDVATTSNNFTILNGTVTATSTLYVCGDWSATTTGIFQHNNGEVIFCATTPGHKIFDGGWPFYKITFNGSGGEWLYQDSTSTAPATTTVIAGTPTFLNAKTGNVSVSGGTLNVDWYLGIHVVAGDSTSTNLDTGDNDITISEASGSSTVWKMSGGSWGAPASSKTTGTGSDGKNPQPNSDGAIRIREYSRTASGAAYYKYNLQIASQPGFSAYNYYSDYGGKYIASVSSTDSDVDLAISQDWHRSIPSQMNGVPDYDGLNEPPLHGSWYCGMHSDLEFSVDSVSVNLGSLYELNSWTATGTTILSVTTSYPGGYTVKAHMEPTLGRLKMTYNSTDYWIIRWPYANSTPAVWDGNCINNGQCGFGYRTSDYNLQGPGASDRFATSTVYAGFATSSTAADPVADSTSAVSGATTTITYKVSVSNLQESGAYSGTVYYICTVNY